MLLFVNLDRNDSGDSVVNCEGLPLENWKTLTSDLIDNVDIEPQVELLSLRPSNMVSSSPARSDPDFLRSIGLQSVGKHSGLFSRISIFSNSTILFDLCTDTVDPQMWFLSGSDFSSNCGMWLQPYWAFQKSWAWALQKSACLLFCHTFRPTRGNFYSSLPARDICKLHCGWSDSALTTASP